MDNVREKISEQRKSRQKKLLVGAAALVILILGITLLEKSISLNITDIVISKTEISDEKAVFIPVKQLDTDIIAVKLSDGNYRLAFNDCSGCYTEFGKHYEFENNADNTGLICENCNSEVRYEEMGFLPEESMPYPIYENEITVNEDSFLLTADYLKKHKQILSELRSGKAVNPYSENPEK